MKEILRRKLTGCVGTIVRSCRKIGERKLFVLFHEMKEYAGEIHGVEEKTTKDNDGLKSCFCVDAIHDAVSWKEKELQAPYLPSYGNTEFFKGVQESHGATHHQEQTCTPATLAAKEEATATVTISCCGNL
ncbi:hypothetical protein MAR_028295 [Mya arenaria]|uniref:Uncharacterized protein n=1 Tax=Mya arenaria TaxID=6604 RepID=A0ABY7DH13_MYAAR|nr:hypothetical protein MAR_028295 [Mya arenaria]